MSWLLCVPERPAASAGVQPSERAKAFHDAKLHEHGGGAGELVDAQAGGGVVQVPEPVSPRYRNRAGKCRAATGATVSSVNRSYTHAFRRFRGFVGRMLGCWHR